MDAVRPGHVHAGDGALLAAGARGRRGMARGRSVLLGYGSLLVTLGAACVVGDDTVRSGAVLASTVLAALALAWARPGAGEARSTRVAHAVLLAGLAPLALHDAHGLLSRAAGHGEPPGALFAATRSRPPTRRCT